MNHRGRQDLGRTGRRGFRVGRLQPLRAIAPVVARSAAGVLGAASTAWDELALELAATTLGVANGVATAPDKVIDVAFAAGFNDLSHFNHAFQAEFGLPPGALRRGRSGRRTQLTGRPADGPTAAGARGSL